MHPLLAPLPTALALAFAVTTLAAQELIAVNFQGTAFGVDVVTGQGRLIGPTGASRCNAMALHEHVLYSTSQVGTTGPQQLVTIDAVTAQATVLFPNLGVDLRGLAESINDANELFGIANGTPDQLVRIDLTTGLVTTVGNTGLTGIQALDGSDASLVNLLAWDVNVGLVRIDRATGVTVDVDPTVGTQGVNIQFLTTFRTNSTATLLGGNTSLYSINRQTGVVTPIGTTTNLADLRGADTHFGRATFFGTGCLTTNGTPAIINAKSSFLAGAALGTFSAIHAPNAVALLVVGLSKTSYQGTPLPINLDLALGTIGCRLLVSPDLTLVAVGNANGLIPLPFTMPPVFGATLHFQCATLEAVPGGLSFSNALTVQAPF